MPKKCPFAEKCKYYDENSLVCNNGGCYWKRMINSYPNQESDIPASFLKDKLVTSKQLIKIKYIEPCIVALKGLNKSIEK